MKFIFIYFFVVETLASPDGQTASTEAEAEALEEEQGDGKQKIVN